MDERDRGLRVHPIETGRSRGTYTLGLNAELLVNSRIQKEIPELRPSERHTNGAREARRAQQF